jgi:Nitrile hydratase, alpha chain
MSGTEKVSFESQLEKVFTKAWADPKYKARLISDPRAALVEAGVSLPAGLDFKVVENTNKLVHLILPPPPSAEMSGTEKESFESQFEKVFTKAWADPKYKARLISDPRAAIVEADVSLPASLDFKVVENTNKLVHLIIPPPPAELSEESLALVAGGMSPIFRAHDLYNLKGNYVLQSWSQISNYHLRW